jgi:hypothetical protein
MFQPFFPSCMVASRDGFLALGGWDEGLSRIVGGDFATTLRVAAQAPLGVIQRPLVAIRQHASNHSGDTEKLNLGDACVLEHVLCARPELAYLATAIRGSVALRRRAVLDSAFSRRDFAAVRDIYRLLPQNGCRAKQQIKRAIAGLPAPLGLVTANLVSR